MTIIDQMIADKIAANPFQAAHIANGLKLAELKTDEERRARYLLYREWRNAGEEPKIAYLRAIEGKPPLTLISKEQAEAVVNYDDGMDDAIIGSPSEDRI